MGYHVKKRFMFTTSGLVAIGPDGNPGLSRVIQGHIELNRLAAHLAVLDVLLIARRRVQQDGQLLAAVRTVNRGFALLQIHGASLSANQPDKNLDFVPVRPHLTTMTAG